MFKKTLPNYQGLFAGGMPPWNMEDNMYSFSYWGVVLKDPLDMAHFPHTHTHEAGRDA